MDRDFLDANVLFSAARSATSRLRDLWRLPQTTLITSAYCVEEARRNLAIDRPEARALGLSQQQLARLAKVRQETISRLETGRHSADPRTVDKLCAALEAVQRSRARKAKPEKLSKKG